MGIIHLIVRHITVDFKVDTLYLKKEKIEQIHFQWEKEITTCARIKEPIESELWLNKKKQVKLLKTSKYKWQHSHRNVRNSLRYKHLCTKWMCTNRCLDTLMLLLRLLSILHSVAAEWDQLLIVYKNLSVFFVITFKFITGAFLLDYNHCK